MFLTFQKVKQILCGNVFQPRSLQILFWPEVSTQDRIFRSKISLTAEYSITLEQLVEFDCNSLCGSGSGDSSIDNAVKLLLPVLKSSIEIETSHQDFPFQN